MQTYLYLSLSFARFEFIVYNNLILTEYNNSNYPHNG